MNYLGHLLLSREDENIMIGNFLADRLTSKEQKKLPEVYQPGIRYHRWIDQTTDVHPEVKAMVSIARPMYGRYAPVAVDVYMDHLLSISWHLYSDEPWNVFKFRIYSTLKKHSVNLPTGYDRGIVSMVDHDWLDQYDDFNGLRDVMRRLDSRAKHAKPFEAGLQALHENKETLQIHFDPFLKDLIAKSDRFFTD